MPPNTTMRPGLPGRPADLVAAQRIAGMDADADDVAGVEGAEIERLERFVGDDRVAELARGRGGDDVEPARRDDADAEGDVARIDEMHLQMRALNGLAGQANGLGERRELVRLYRRSATVSNRGSGRLRLRRPSVKLSGPSGAVLAICSSVAQW